MESNIIEQKKCLRKEMRSRRASMPTEERLQASHDIITRLLENPIYKSSSLIMAYVSMPEEVQLNDLFEAAFASNKLLAIPLIVGRGTMKPVYLPSMESLVVGDFGILTVRQECRKLVEFSDIECVIVPGAAFDHQGNRLGLGGGYYDRFLERVPMAKRVALAFDYQLVDNIPTEPHDLKVDVIITRSEIINLTR